MDRMSRRGDQKAQGGDDNKSHTPVTLAKRPSDAATSSPDEKPTGSSESNDLVYVHSPCESGDGYNIIRQRSDRLEVGELRTLKEGTPVAGELVKLTPRTGNERLFDCEVLVDNSPPRQPRNGPAKVSSESYRDNWDQIFGSSAGSTHGGGDQLN